MSGCPPAVCAEESIDLRAVGQIELEILIVQSGCAAELEVLFTANSRVPCKLVALCLKAHDVGGNADVGEFFGDIENLHFDRVRSRRRHAVIGHALVNSANQVRAGVRQVEAEVAAGVGLGAGRFFHALGQFDQDDFIAGGGLAGGSIVERAG